ncbi:DNA gyrase subunit A [Cupriavidus taiwanensis]|uniref:DNA gyrase subunit A n=1 Tax=Cupriavidus taiwanensis TaxID=164546 RepID=A0A375IED3_9BURK|nr:DNA gyrase subunit A [Cupriavidus taiwanensis]SOY56217.1 DNA gyrase, subunit A, type II topoisomerase [Cupriavidus taiwanensis]SOY56892.1 DNA gyrase, subunit A, type II topoisomerase [Cupriavidus taiwanensis]SOY90850.1 DNA gyrase, subunit A, type II topoisomerase [Cupriavidus taiwanensis]SOZ25185.1 DNA gyrase, subunit A, type II topoisomerase [Cupriavidus taiwanensis]SOZ63656.1 DNA gyrase, subunit A, type II topoisomerase [Cupriavidus taiwanensis]
MDPFAKETLPVSLEEEMRRSYLDYAMSVIVGRALPDVRDGLKPVHRRVLFAMHELNNDWNRAYKKSARIVGDVIGKYHPHGDTAVYDTIVRMAQDFSLRYMLVDGQGNFGSVDGDNAAAMRYTEIRLSKIAHEMLHDIDKETVDFDSNYDGSEKEPSILPARIPNLLINGSSGIAVGMATNIPPHNLNEIVDGCLHLLRNPQATVDELIELIPAPDFPTAGIIYGIQGVREGYRTGRGRVVMRAKTHFEDIDRGQRQAIIVDELPYQVNKRTLLERIAELVTEKKIEGISDIRDESDKSGMRVVIELKRNEVPEVVLNNLYKNTQLQDTFGMNMVALVDRQPRLLNLRQMLEYFLAHRREVVTRRTVFELRKARERGHVLEGLAVALANIDEFIAIIKAAPTPPIAKQELMSKAWDSALVREMLARAEGETPGGRSSYRPDGLPAVFGMQADGLYRLSDGQAQEILQMRLQRLTGLEQDKIVQEYRDIMAEIADLLDILARPERITTIIIDELTAIRAEFGDERRSQIELNATELDTEDLITPQDMVVTLSHSGYMKSQPISEYRAQKRGGRGKQATATKEDDWIDTLFVANTHDYILCFSNRGRLYWLKVYEVPQGSRNSRGRPIVNMFPLSEGEKINVILPVRQFDAEHFIFMATARGTVKKTALTEFSNPRKAGIIAVDLDEGDYLIGAAVTDGQHDVMLFSDAGKAVRFDENDVRPMGRQARGVRGMNLEDGQAVIAMLVAPAETAEESADAGVRGSVLTATENGYGKRTPIAEYTRHGRGTKGMIAIQTSERNGRVVAAALVSPEDEIMLITTGGVLIRTRVAEIREMGRATQGVTLINVDEGTKLSGLQRIVESDADNGGNGEEPDEAEGAERAEGAEGAAGADADAKP